MKNVIAIIVLSFYGIAANAQDQKGFALDFADVFVIEIDLKKELVKEKCVCSNRKDNCILYEIKVNKVLYCSPNNAFDSIKLTKIKYMVFSEDSISKMNAPESLTVSAKPSTSEKYLSFTRTLNIDSLSKRNFYHHYAYLSDIIRCKKKKDKFEKYLLNHEAIERNAKNP